MTILFTVQERHQIYLKFIQSNNIKWQNTFLPIMGNGIVLSTMFFALRGMANLPVDSMTNGGVLWFTDLTVQDPYFLLPVIAVSSVYINMKLGAEGQSIDSLPPIMKIFFKGVILMSFPIMCHFPTVSIMQTIDILVPNNRYFLGPTSGNGSSLLIFLG